MRLLRRQWFLVALFFAFAMGMWAGERLSTALFPPTRLLAALMLLFTSVSLPGELLGGSLRRPAPVLWGVFLNLGMLPPLAFAASRLLSGDFALGLVIAGAVPSTLASAVLWTGMAGGCVGTAMLVTLLTNLLAVVVTWGWVILFVGRSIPFDHGAMLIGLVLFAALPVLLGQVGRFIPRVATGVDGRKALVQFICKILILLVVFQSARASRIGLGSTDDWDPLSLAGTFVLTISVHLLVWAVGYWSGTRIFVRPERIAVAFAGSQKTLPVAATIIADHFAGSGAAILPVLFFHFGQLLVDTFLVEWLNQRSGTTGSP